MSSKWLKRLMWVLLTPLFLFILAMMLLYVPPVQNLLRSAAMEYASRATGMRIGVERVDLRFPLNLLVRGVTVVQPAPSADTLFTLQRLNLQVQVRPLLRGEVSVDHITVQEAMLRSGSFIEGLSVRGRLGYFYLRSHGIDLKKEEALLNKVELRDMKLHVILNDTAAAPNDTTAVSFAWKARLQQLLLQNISVDLCMGDSLQLAARIGEASLEDAFADPALRRYSWKQLLVSGAAATVDRDSLPPSGGFDASHIALRNVNVGIDSVCMDSGKLTASIRQLSMDERSGLSITSLAGKLLLEGDTLLALPNWRLTTPTSELSLDARVDAGTASARFDAVVGKQDVLLFAGGLPEDFVRAYPFHPLRLHASIAGRLEDLQLNSLTADLPGAFSLAGHGAMSGITGAEPGGNLELQMTTGNLSFLTALADSATRARIAVPDSMRMEAVVRLEGDRTTAELTLHEGEGSASLRASYRAATGGYRAKLEVRALQMHHFLPHDSAYTFTASARARGEGFDVHDARTTADLHLQLGELHYGRRNFSGMELTAEARYDSTKIHLSAGDLLFRFRARSTLHALVERGTRFAGLLEEQLRTRVLDHAALRRALPSASLVMRAGTDNPLSEYLAEQEITYQDFTLLFGLSPRRGINGRTAIHGLRLDSIQLDTVFFAIRQDTARMTLQGGVVNAPGNSSVFRSTLTGEIRSHDAELLVNFLDEHGHTGLNLGLNVRPMVGGGRRGRANGLVLKLIPETPVIAFRNFHFVDNFNWIYLHENMRVYAHVEMADEEEMRFRLRSVRGDTVSLQNMDVELQRFRLDEISRILPYMPKLAGLLSIEANYVQTGHSLQVAAEARVQNLVYEQRKVGNLGAGVTWLPGEGDTHYLNSYFRVEDEEVVTADAVVGTGTRSTLEVTTAFHHFPLSIAGSFLPERVVTLSGDVDGEVLVSGSPDQPRMTGSLTLDSVSVYARQAGTHYHFDHRPVRIQDNRIFFDGFAIYTTSRNPFTIDGSVSFADLRKPAADLTLQARNYTLLDAPRTHESILYGQIFVDLDATLKGPLDALAMRGKMNVLGNTDVAYVLENSPLTVEDRLGELVTFTSFKESDAAPAVQNAPTMSLGGMNLSMSVDVAEAVRLRIDLSADRSSRIELEGGGTLNLQYSPQGDVSLVGRYTLIGGMMKYALPVIPLKEFQLVSGSSVDWTGHLMNPTLNLKATERVRAAVASNDNGGSRSANFDVSIRIKNKLAAPDLTFDIEAPEDASLQNELAAMGAEERSKQAVGMLATGLYLKSGVKGGGLNMGSALNTVLQNQINSIAGMSKSASINVGIEEGTSSETGGKTTDYSFRYSQRFFNDRVQIIIGGKVSTGANATNDVESFIDNVSLEYRLDGSGTRYIRAFHNKNYESVLDGEITETGVGLVLRRKVDKLGELFLFKSKTQ
ncbi:MAG: translocation/assembly module TamB domain-containing protein [Prevotellaceae bacterium]|jgi:hypothetical protein|nr:translocation/assembly module TamB domain-containing protein [Prevotellaceae bacterium]